MKKLSIILFTICAANLVIAQVKGGRVNLVSSQVEGVTSKKSADPRMPFIDKMKEQIDPDLFFVLPKNQNRLISIAASINWEGKVDTVYYSTDKANDMELILNWNESFVKKLKTISFSNDSYKNKIIMFPVLFKDRFAEELVYEAFYLSDYEYLWPNFNQRDNEKQIVYLEPYYYLYHKSKL